MAKNSAVKRTIPSRKRKKKGTPKKPTSFTPAEESRKSTITIAPMPPQLLPGTIATPSLLATLLLNKFLSLTPFCCQSLDFKRYGIHISEATMRNWIQEVASNCLPLLEPLREYLLSGPIIQVARTELQVLKQPESRRGNTPHMWFFLGGRPRKEVVLLHYSPWKSDTLSPARPGEPVV